MFVLFYVPKLLYNAYGARNVQFWQTVFLAKRWKVLQKQPIFNEKLSWIFGPRSHLTEKKFELCEET